MPDLMKLLESKVKSMEKTVNKAVDATGVKKVVENTTKPLSDQFNKMEPTVKELVKFRDDLVKFRDDVKKKVFGDMEGQMREMQVRQNALEAKVAALEGQLAAAKKGKH